jgi:hypothetical protein
MKITDALKVIDAGWVRKPKGFRVHFNQQGESGWETGFSPGEKGSPLTSDVVAWRLAWKLAQAAKPDSEEALVNIYVVDDLGEPIKYYATNRFEVFNEREI